MRFLQTFLFLFACYGIYPSVMAKKSGKSFFKKKERTYFSCLEMKKECRKNGTCSKIYKKIEKNCKFVRNGCILSDNLIVEGTRGASIKSSELEEKRKNCTTLLDDIGATKFFSNKCDCSEASQRKRRKCDGIYNLVFANPCKNKKYDDHDLHGLIPKKSPSENNGNGNDVGNGTEAYYRNETQHTPIARNTHNIALRLTPPPSTQTDQRLFTENGKLENTEKKKNNMILTTSNDTVFRNQNPKIHNTICDSLSEQENILIVAFLVSGTALLLLILFGGVVCYKKFKIKKKQQSEVPYDKTEVVKLNPVRDIPQSNQT